MYSKIKSIINEDSEELISLVKLFYNNKLSTEALLFFINKKFILTKTDKSKIIEVINKEKLVETEGVTEKKISIIIPTYNRAKILPKAIKSILEQKYSNYEIIVVDDCSSDSTKQVVNKIQDDNSEKDIKYIRNEENLYAGLSRKKGYNNSTGEYVFFLDDDDFLVDDNFFKKIMNVHNRNKNLAFVGANAFIYNSKNGEIIISNISIEGNNKKTLGEIKGDRYLNVILEKGAKPNTFTTIFRKELLDKIDFKNMDMMNDSAIFVRSLLVGDAYIIEDICGVNYIHSSNISSNLSVDLIIETFNEKIWALNSPLSEGKIDNPADWLYRQVNASLRYYILGNKVLLDDLNKLLSWVNTNTSGLINFKLKVNIYKLHILKKIKTVLKD